MSNQTASATPKARMFLKDLLSDKQNPYFKSIRTSKAHSKLPSMFLSRDDAESSAPIVVELRLRIQQLENELRTKEREIERLNKINQFLLSQNSNKESLIAEERKSFRRVKEQLVIERERKPQVVVQTDVVKQKITVRNSILFDGQNFLSQVTNDKGEQPNAAPIMEDQFRLAAVLDFDCEDAMGSYMQDPQNKFVSSLLGEEDKFVSILQGSGFQKISFIYEKLRRATNEHKQFFCMMLRLKMIIKAALSMSSASNLDDALECIIQQCVKCLNCDRASCFILDEQKGQLWSKVAKGVTGVLRLPANQGIVGHVATSKKLLNIHKAYSDPRFNPEFDKRTNYKTDTILCLPILSKNDKCLGVIQCINKVDGIFSKEDECLGRMLCEFSMVVLSRAISEDERVITISKLRQCVKTGVTIRNQHPTTLLDKLMLAERMLKHLMNVDIARVVFEKEGKLYFATENGSLEETDTYQSLMGLSIQQRKTILVPNCYDNINYSPIVDLQTSLPVVCVPVVSPNGKTHGGFMLPNVRGIQSLVVQIEPRLQPLDEEVLEAFSQQLLELLI